MNKNSKHNRLNPLFCSFLVNLIFVDEVMDFGFTAILAAAVIVFIIAGTASGSLIIIQIDVAYCTLILIMMVVVDGIARLVCRGKQEHVGGFATQAMVYKHTYARERQQENCRQGKNHRVCCKLFHSITVRG